MDFDTSKAKAELHESDGIIPEFGYHVIWNRVLEQVLLTKGELATQRGRDRHAVAHAVVLNSKKHPDKTVGYLPRKLLGLCSMIIDQGGDIVL